MNMNIYYMYSAKYIGFYEGVLLKKNPNVAFFMVI